MADITDLVNEVIEHYSKSSSEKQQLPDGAGTCYYYWVNGDNTSTE